MNGTKTGEIFTRPPHQNTTQSTIFHKTKRISVGFSNGAYTAAVKNLNLVSTNPTQTLYMRLKTNLQRPLFLKTGYSTKLLTQSENVTSCRYIIFGDYKLTYIMTIIRDLYQGAPEFKSGHASKVLGEIFRGFP